jgi:hypothetical protein
MELHKLEPQIGALDITGVHISSICSEEAPLEPESSAIPDTSEEMVPQTPVELVGQSPLGVSVIETNNQMHVLIVDDNDINLKVSEVSRHLVTPLALALFGSSLSNLQ